MAYSLPMVKVYQEYSDEGATTQSAQLPPCIIGPCYHIIDHTEDEILALCDTYTIDGLDSAFFPNNAPGALIQEDSVEFRFKNPYLQIKDGVVINSMENNRFELDSVEDIEVGDYVEFVGLCTLRVTDVNATNNSILTNRTLPVEDYNDYDVVILRLVDDIIISPKDFGEDLVHLDTSSERFSLYNIKSKDTGLLIYKSELYVSYKALRQDLSEVRRVYSVDDITANYGKISPENPLAFGLMIAMSNAAVGIMAIGVDSDDLAGYTAAKDRLEQEDPVYAIVPLTFDTAVLGMFKMHAQEFSTPEISKWRMALGCTKLATHKELCKGTGRLTKDGDGDFVVLTDPDPESTIMSSHADAGDILYIADDEGNEYQYIIASVLSEDILTVVQSAPFDTALFTPYTPVNKKEYGYRIEHMMTKEEQATWVAEASKAYGDQRFINVFPDICIVDERELPGYYLCCAVAAGIAGLPSHYGFTRLSVGGISGVKHSGDYFNNDQLDIIAGGGTFIFTQQNPTSIPYIRHQLTTDMSSVEKQEMSFVKNYDYISYMCRDVLQAFIGRYNITSSTLGTIRTALNSVLENIKLDSQARIGSRLLSYTVNDISQSADTRDRVEAYVEVSLPYPLNTLGLHLRSVFLQITA